MMNKVNALNIYNRKGEYEVKVMRSFFHVNEGLDLLRSIQGCLSSLCLLVGLVDDEALHDCVHRNTVNRHEEHSHCEGNHEHELNSQKGTMRRYMGSRMFS